MNIINLCGHDIIVVDESGGIKFKFKRSEKPLILGEKEGRVSILNNGLRVVDISYFFQGDLPPEIDGRYYIVSSVIKNFFPDRKDFLIPKGYKRDHDGLPVGCTYFGR